MHDLDWGKLDTAMNPTRNRFRFDDVRHLFRKVAFDVYKPLNGSDQLWELRAADDGQTYLYALYETPEDITTQSSDQTSPWKATSDQTGENVTLSYQNIPLVRYAGANEGFNVTEAELFAEFLEARAQESDFVNSIMNRLPEAKREVLAGLLAATQRK